MGTRAVDYDQVAPSYDRRYQENDYSGVAHTLLEFVGSDQSTRSLEVGCGTGHWLSMLGTKHDRIAGVDISKGMLRRAKLVAPSASLVLGSAEALPWADRSFDRVFCINAFHHFADKEACLLEARRILGQGGGFMTVGLDPHTGTNRWWIYDYFREARAIDERRYPASGEIRETMAAVGFTRCETKLAQHLPRNIPAEVAIERGLLDKSWTSQLTVLTDHEYEDGMARLRSDIEDSRAAGETLMLSADLRLYATVGWVQWRHS
jgi:ubiquinone/menaquinone biosynthesis C-methylase UbiE